MKMTMIVLLLTLAAGAPVAGAYADAPPAKQQANSGTNNANTVSDSQLKQFAAARADLNSLRTKYMAELKSADTTADRKRVRGNARKAMIAAIKRHGMTVQQFRHIAVVITNSPELRKKLKAMEPGG
ncbi:MAG TPA: DUF4168 domain-containing protein [Gammaproteobacteria bacterium]|nr:DUF4168 domain-containing protein [Gammaproteobacteria bacterium]